jgi:hypothetical protein
MKVSTFKSIRNGTFLFVIALNHLSPLKFLWESEQETVTLGPGPTQQLQISGGVVMNNFC